jgi:hypothetical protein
MHRGALTNDAIDGDITSRLADKTIDHTKAKPSPFPRAFRCEKRLPHIIKNFFANPCSRIPNRYHDVTPRGERLG